MLVDQPALPGLRPTACPHRLLVCPHCPRAFRRGLDYPCRAATFGTPHVGAGRVLLLECPRLPLGAGHGNRRRASARVYGGPPRGRVARLRVPGHEPHLRGADSRSAGEAGSQRNAAGVRLRPAIGPADAASPRGGRGPIPTAQTIRVGGTPVYRPSRATPATHDAPGAAEASGHGVRPRRHAAESIARGRGDRGVGALHGAGCGVIRRPDPVRHPAVEPRGLGVAPSGGRCPGSHRAGRVREDRPAARFRRHRTRHR